MEGIEGIKKILKVLDVITETQTITNVNMAILSKTVISLTKRIEELEKNSIKLNLN